MEVDKRPIKTKRCIIAITQRCSKKLVLHIQFCEMNWLIRDRVEGNIKENEHSEVIEANDNYFHTQK